LRSFAAGLSRLAGFNRDAATLAAGLRHRDRDLQHPDIYSRLRLIYIGAFRKRRTGQ
jgi:hypothetical protein